MMQSMRKILATLLVFAPLLGAAELSGTWKFQPPPNPQAPPNRQPRETIYVFKVDGNKFTGTSVTNGIGDISDGVIDGSHITFDRMDGSGVKVPFKGEINGDELTVQMARSAGAPSARCGPGGPRPGSARSCRVEEVL